MGISVVKAKDGQEAIDCWQQGGIELILMDIQMPVMDGYKATQKIREQEATNPGQRIPIIAMTANAMEEDKQLCLQNDMDDYLSKPFRLEQLNALAAKWLPESEDQSCSVSNMQLT